MPTLSDRFSAYPVSVTLDGNGDGTVQFQAVGKNIRVTNLYVSVSTRTLQATCTMYKGQIGAQYAIKSTNSGSTGATAAGSIDLLDGESLFIVWDGGDPGAIATATFTGIALPFNQTPEVGTSFLWDDPIAAGDGSLIYPGLQSIDYVTGVSGWRIQRNGDVEFNNGTFRGNIIVSDPDGSSVEISAGPGTPIKFTPPNFTGVTLNSPGSIRTDISAAGPSAYILISTPEITSGGNTVGPAQVFLSTERADGVPFSGFNAAGSVLEVPNLLVGEEAVNETDLNKYLRGEVNSHTFALTAVSSATVAVTFANAFPVGVTPMVSTNIDNGVAAFARWCSRAISVTNTGFTLFVFKGDAADPAATGNLKVLWSAQAEG